LWLWRVRIFDSLSEPQNEKKYIRFLTSLVEDINRKAYILVIMYYLYEGIHRTGFKEARGT